MSTDTELPLGRRSGKSDAAFRTISEVAEDLEVPQHVLRFWEGKFPQVKPLKRGGGRRYYRPEDVQLLRKIRDLLYSEGYTIKGVQKLLREGGHKDNGSNRPDADSEPRLNLDRDDDEDLPEAMEDEPPAMDDGEQGGDDEGTDEPEASDIAPRRAALPPEVRRELAGLLDELEQLRALLQPRER